MNETNTPLAGFPLGRFNVYSSKGAASEKWGKAQ